MESTAVHTACPDGKLLIDYVSGLLAETAAAELAEHLDRCERCRRRVDDFIHRSDSMLATLQRSPEAVSSSEDAQLALMIQKAQQLGSLGHQETVADTDPPSPVSLVRFVDCLHKSGLMHSSEVDLFLKSNRHADSQGLANVLISRGKLTEFQAQALLLGRWKGLLLGNYIILEKIAHGGMSTVFKARHRNMERVVCLKVPNHAVPPSPQVIERFRREAKTLAALNHPNIIVAHDADEEGAIPFLVMEFVEGRDLARLVAAEGPLPVETAVTLMIQTARALDYAHREGVVHRDIKPHNLLLDESRAVKILDMGLARFDSYLEQTSDATNHASMTASGVIMGTIDYMAPEQALNCRKADHRSDIYSLGCTLYYLLSGEPLFSGETLMEKLVAHREHPAPNLTALRKDIPLSLNAVFQHMLRKEPAQRYQSMADLAHDLEAVKAGNGSGLKCQARSEPKRRIRTYVWAAGIVAAAFAGVGIWQAPAWLAPNGDRTPQQVQRPVAKPKTSKPKIIGHPKTLANGGPGRALIVVPHAWFYGDQFQAVEKSLKNRNIDFATASSKSGAANPKYGRIKPVTVELLLDQVKVNDFDAIVFLTGNINEFTHKNPKTGKLVKQLIGKCVDSGLVVAGVSTAVNILKDTGITSECSFHQDGACAVGTFSGRNGAIVMMPKSGTYDKLVQLIFAKNGLRKKAIVN